ncbi:UDP-N-acetylmuramoyl-L-alanine--D-glutamate ligase [Alicyclobacillus cycloheptanicus]|uniref:UDP-N-acetylmuramoylalanine--D-glutamate ligase n=1 Tax=Alicyclobacillus cycloheptanicus TaxID=1457 RepID=A0ABT9XML7_9BACL|nr:UDP-N-acetylmuramoyl-L-alanine--D-glutamate ligase [Alicyclobacillus cycloheptanicus]MDQ0190968.1 UDP-N-acetylmuramoylalanine--D-glutamate ligase [Alicyclobacillus cycloheptanicus]
MELHRGQRALIVGLAKSGEAAAYLLKRRGLEVIVNDRRERLNPDYEAEKLEAAGIQTVFGGHPVSLLDDRPDFIVKNPGVPYRVPLIAEAMQRGIPVYTEIEVASWLTHAPIYAITGSNGKTTTTTLVGEMLAEAKQDPVVAGNIGLVLSGVVEQVRPDQPIVLEVSSFQLMGTESFHPKIAALLNLYPAHLDYHETFEAYVDAKWRLFQNLGEHDTAVLNYDQPLIRERAATLTTPVVWFSRSTEVSEGVFVRGSEVVVRRQGVDTPVIRLSAIAMKGEHNLENALAATAIAVWAGAPLSAAAYVLTRFRGIEHRLEFVRTVEGADYYNDSKATNPEAALRALRSFEKNVVWIAGGLDRGDDFRVMLEDLRTRVRAAYLIGQSAERLAAVCQEAGVPHVEQVPSLEQAVVQAHRTAAPGDVILLSPACASWDMFASFEVRGRMFKDIVHTL